MAKLCNEHCDPVCDFCKFYHDDGEGIEGNFAGEGICEFNGERIDALGECDEFVCFNIEEQN